MITADTPWRHLGVVSYAMWHKRIADAGGLSEAAERDVWAALGDDSALALAMMKCESSYGSDFDAIPASKKNVWNLQIMGVGLAFNTIREGAKAWRERLYDPLYKQGIYARTETIADLIEVYAPRSDGNDTDGYIRTVVATINANGLDPIVTTPSTPPEPVDGEQPNPSNSTGLESEQPMALEIVNRVIGVRGNAPDTPLNSGPGRLRPIIHNTDNPSRGADALMHATFVANGGGSSNVSFHFAVDSKRAVQILPLNRIGYHASDGCDNRSTDTGCFDGIAIENCDNIDGDIDRTFANLAELLACIEFGDTRIDYGGRPIADFAGFIDRTLGHHDVAFDAKWCPSDFMNRYGEAGYKPKLKALAHTALAAKRGVTPADPSEPTAPIPVEAEVLPGLDFAVAARLFNGGNVKGVKGEDGRNYPFDKNGPVSNLWLANGRATGQWPALVQILSYEDGARRYFRFEGGATVIAIKGQSPRWLKEAA